MSTQEDRLTAREGWALGRPPREGMTPHAEIVDGNALLFWAIHEEYVEACEAGDTQDYTDAHVIDWPFGDDDLARRADLVALGFHVEVL